MTQHRTVTTDFDMHRFERDGYVVVRGLVARATVAELRGVSLAALSPLLAPVEYEVDVGYPGAPSSRDTPGGGTSRRLLNALGRDACYRRWATSTELGGCVRDLLQTSEVCVSQCHHNCVMTKHPNHSSRTGWHQDIRYWSFDRPELVSVWLALGKETIHNGALRVIPGSHRMVLDRGQLDAALFLRDDLPQNRDMIATALPVELDEGDVLLFDCKLFHAAGSNETDEVKLSLVFTYHASNNLPIPGTRSANYPSLPVD